VGEAHGFCIAGALDFEEYNSCTFMKWKILLTVLPPLVLTSLLYPPIEKTILPDQHSVANFVIEDVLSNKPTVIGTFGDVLNVPSFLKWYVVTLRNRSTVNNTHCISTNPPIVRFHFVEGDPKSYEYSLNLREGYVFGLDGGRFESKYPDYYLRGGEQAYFIAPSWEKYTIDVGLAFDDGCEVATPLLRARDWGKDFPDINFDITFDVSLRPYWPAWFVGFGLILIFWVYFLSACLTLRAWYKEK
jgi:hypothetical protein